MKQLLGLGLLATMLLGCSLAPTYERPPMPIPEDYKETGKWVVAKIPPSTVPPEPWWHIFEDRTLNELEDQVIPANQNIKLAYYRYQEARALVQVAQAALFPTIRGLFNADRQKTSTHIANPSEVPQFNGVLVGSDLNYEVDVWGRIRNAIAMNKDLAKASSADLAAVTLSLHAELATDYFTLRGYDESQRILDTTVTAYRKALYLTKKRYQGGAAPIADVDEAETQLENAKTMAADNQLRRAQMEHAIAVLIGQIPSHFNLSPEKLSKRVIELSPDLPSTLLERRPDIAAAEARVAAANANIGVARAAFFPVFNLSGTIGYQSKSLSNLISKPSLFWSLGPLTALNLVQPVAAVTIFDGGRLWGLLKQAKAQYYQTVATYRQTVLTAFQEVEDNLVAVRRLDQENRSQTLAARAAKRALIQAQNRYAGGIVTFLDVVVIENTALQNELSEVNVLVRRQVATVQLIKALGGGWVSFPINKRF